MDLGSLSKGNTSQIAAVPCPGVRVNYPVAVPCCFSLANVGNLPRIAASSLGDYLGKSDRILFRSGVVGSESPVIGWSVDTLASVDKGTAQG